MCRYGVTTLLQTFGGASVMNLLALHESDHADSTYVGQSVVRHFGWSWSRCRLVSIVDVLVANRFAGVEVPLVCASIRWPTRSANIGASGVSSGKFLVIITLARPLRFVPQILSMS